MDKYLPILIIVVSFILSTLGKKKKQGKIAQETDLSGKRPEESTYKEQTPAALTDSYRKIVEDKPQKTVIQRGVKEEIESFSHENAAIESEEEDNSPFTFKEEEVMNAVIYAEIINKKNW